MFKKIFTIIIIIATNVSIAGTPYVGGSLGLTDLSIYSSGKMQAGGVSKLFGGYGSTFGAKKNIYLGSEFTINFAHYPNVSGTTYGIGPSFIPGIMITKDTMIYARVGKEIDRHTHSSVTYSGNQLGVGLQTHMTKNWYIRGEYIHLSNINNPDSSNSQMNVGLVYKFN